MIAPAKDNTDQWPEAVIGIRVSTDKQDATAHEHRARDWCESNHYRIVATYGKLHEGESGGDDVDEREMGLALKDAIRRGCLLVVDAQDRLSRVVPDLYAIALRIMHSKADIRFLDDGNTLRKLWSDPWGKAMFGFKSVCAQLERDLASTRTRKNLADVKSQGYRAGSIEYGMMEDRTRPIVWTNKAGKTKTRYPLVPNLDEKRNLARFIELQQAGYSETEMAEIAEKEGIINRKGRPFAAQRIGILVRRAMGQETNKAAQE